MKKRSIMIIFGIPGSGKGTQSALLSERYGLNVISTGAMLRDLTCDVVRSESPKDLENARNNISDGAMVDDYLVVSLVKSAFAKYSESNLILDGFPRNVKQAEMLDEILLRHDDISISCVIYLDVPKNVALTRIVDRVVCNGCGSIFCSSLDNVVAGQLCKTCSKCYLECRVDDSVRSAENRLHDSLQQIESLLNYYEKYVEILRVNGCASVDFVNNFICSRLDSMFI